jgi:folate-dependent phosphoribosylglycinamide formyltransferase PurN
MLKLAAFVSGRGSNLRQVYSRVPKEKLAISFIVSDKLECGAVNFANEKNIPVLFVSEIIKEGYVDYHYLIDQFRKSEIDLILLAGFLKKIPDYFVDAFDKMIINIHPALLPKYGGKGMYGLNVHRAVFDAEEKLSGATIHFVDSIYDNGKIIARKSVDISNAKSPEEVAELVLQIEHELLPFIIEKFCDNKISYDGGVIKVID